MLGDGATVEAGGAWPTTTVVPESPPPPPPPPHPRPPLGSQPSMSGSQHEDVLYLRQLHAVLHDADAEDDTGDGDAVAPMMPALASSVEQPADDDHDFGTMTPLQLSIPAHFDPGQSQQTAMAPLERAASR